MGFRMNWQALKMGASVGSSPRKSKGIRSYTVFIHETTPQHRACSL